MGIGSISGTNADSFFLPVAIGEFASTSKAVVDLYVKISRNHYVRIIKSGMDYDLTQINRYENKNVTHLFIKKDEYSKFTEHLVRLSDVLSTSNASVRNKLKVLLRTAEHVFLEIAELGVDRTVFNRALQTNKAMLEIIASNPNLLEMIDEISNFKNEIITHSLATSIVASMMAQAMKWNGSKTLINLSLGALLHDVGLCELPRDLVNKPRDKMILLESEIYESHTIRGMTRVKDVPDISQDVLAIIRDHHETPDGKGYPRRLKGDSIFPLARVTAFADQLVDLILKSPLQPHPKDMKSAIDILFHTKKSEFPEIYFEAARKLLTQTKPQLSK